MQLITKHNPTVRAKLRNLSAAVLLGVLSLASASAATTFQWTGASSPDLLWATPGNWSPSGPPGTADAVIFGADGTVADQFTVNNSVGAGTAVAALSYTNTTGAWHVLQIPEGLTLTVSGPVTVGGLAGGSITTAVAVVDGGTLVATGTPFNLGNGSTSSGSKSPGVLDLSGLSNFVYSATGGTIGLGTFGSRSDGVLILAAITNSITASTININGATGTGSTPTFNLGAGTNVINVNTFNVGGGRSTTALQFATDTGGLRLRGTGGTDSDRTTMVVGNRNTGGTSTLTTTGNVFFNNHPVDLEFSTLTLGQMSRSGSEVNFKGVGVFQFDQGTVDANTVSMGLCSGNSTNSGALGTLTVGAGGTLTVGNVSLANVTATAAGCYASGTLNISGVVNCAGNITKTTSASSTGAVSVASSGQLVVGGSLGSAGNPLDSLTISDSTLTLRAGALAPANVTTVTTGGSTNAINISVFPAITAYPAQFQVLKYADAIGGSGFDNNIGLGTLPAASPAFEGYLSNNTATLTIDVVIIGGPPPAQPVTWAGTQSGAWDTSTLNWLAGATPTNYNNAGDFVTFNDTASTSTVYLVTDTLTPGSVTVNNNSLAYTFTGAGKLSGATGLTKEGSGTLVLDNTGVNDFSGAVSLTGTLQLGTGGTSGSLPPTASVTDNGTLIFNHSDNSTAANVISGSGTVVKNGANTLTLSGASSFSGGVTVNGGTLRTANINALGSGATVTVNAGATLVLGAVHTNSVVLAGGTLGTSVSLNPTPMDLTAAAGTTSTLYMADPQNLAAPTDGLEVNFTNGTWHGSGTVLVATVLNDPSPDGGNGFRLRSVNASDFSGTLILSNRVKGELQTTVAGPFSPAGTGKVVLYGGVLTNNSLTGTYSELNLRNNSAGATVLGNDVELAGTGLVVLDPLGSAAAGSSVTMGALKLGAGQELGVNLNGSGPDHPVVFQSVTLTGGNATFSPKTQGWNTTPQIGSDLVLNNISESAPSGLIMNGLRTLTLTGNNNYSGDTVVSNGTLLVNGSKLGAGSVTVYGGTLGGTGLITGPVTIAAAGTLAPGTSIGTLSLAGALTLSGTNVMELNKSGTALTSDQVAGITTLTCGGTLVLNITGDALAAGDKFKLYSFNSVAGTFAAISPETPGTGLLWNTNQLTTDGTLEVVSAVAPQPFISSISISGTDVIISGTNASAGGSYYVLSSTNVALPLPNWTPILTQSFNGVNFSFTNAMSPGEHERFYLLQIP